MIVWNVGNESVVIQDLNLRDILINWKTRCVVLTYGDDEWRKWEGVPQEEMERLASVIGATPIREIKADPPKKEKKQLYTPTAPEPPLALPEGIPSPLTMIKE